MDTFICKDKHNSWPGTIINFENYGAHCEFTVHSRSSIMVVFGKTSRGYFACMPDFNSGCHLVDIKDIFWNTERLTGILGKVDGITVASALVFLNDKLI
jgi:hypothetical protein